MVDCSHCGGWCAVGPIRQDHLNFCCKTCQDYYNKGHPPDHDVCGRCGDPATYKLSVKKLTVFEGVKVISPSKLCHTEYLCEICEGYVVDDLLCGRASDV